MQTFLPYPSFTLSAACLDDKRLGKQRVECLQILQALKAQDTCCEMCKGKGVVKMQYVRKPAPKYFTTQCPRCVGKGHEPTGWIDHPCTKMWKGYTDALVEYGIVVCIEWRERGFNDTCRDKIHAFAICKHYTDDMHIAYPPWLGDDRLHSSHRAALLAKNFTHYSTFNWSEKPELNYYWPA